MYLFRICRYVPTKKRALKESNFSFGTKAAKSGLENSNFFPLGETRRRGQLDSISPIVVEEFHIKNIPRILMGMQFLYFAENLAGMRRHQ